MANACLAYLTMHRTYLLAGVHLVAICIVAIS